MTQTTGGDTGTWCARCGHMLVPHQRGWKHHSRDDWSRNAHGIIDCGCVHAGRNCSPERPSPKEQRETRAAYLATGRMLGRRQKGTQLLFEGRRPDAVVIDEVQRFQVAGVTSGSFASGGWFTIAPGALYTWAPDASTED
jgi:hypothetical protein